MLAAQFHTADWCTLTLRFNLWHTGELLRPCKYCIVYLSIEKSSLSTIWAEILAMILIWRFSKFKLNRQIKKNRHNYFFASVIETCKKVLLGMKLSLIKGAWHLVFCKHSWKNGCHAPCPDCFFLCFGWGKRVWCNSNSCFVLNPQILGIVWRTVNKFFQSSPAAAGLVNTEPGARNKKT